MKQYKNFWKDIKSWMGKKEDKKRVRSKRFFQLLKVEQNKTTPLPLPDFDSRVIVGLQKIEGDAKEKSPCFSCPQQSLPWALLTAGVLSVIIAVCSLYIPFSSKFGVNETFFVLTPEVIILECLSETEDFDLNNMLLSH